MLKLENIVKIYKAADIEVVALKGVSIQFRKNEFVSILGPSGCGKTTLLNVIGGLDHYDEGDLVINGKSTHDFKERDWDVYRNHRIGFIFQSYNLIPQSTILENVELSLTIAGLKKEERIARAKNALARVGLEGLEKKHPNQLSGGQCQRVAIARALVNEPDILLADEPTGALDSVTSIQIMDLIKEIAKDKLVIMVTHNPDLAKQYSTRIITLKDGLVETDSAPYVEAAEEENAPAVVERAKMSWWTAFKLSSKNLLSKAKRTILTVIASSIGIVGVSAVLAVSNGISEYIVSIQDDLLSGNPIGISGSTYDLTSLMNSVSDVSVVRSVTSGVRDGKIDVNFMVEMLSTLSSSVVSNTIDENYVRYVEQMPKEYYAAMSEYYGIDITSHIYTDTVVKTGGEQGGEDETKTMSLRGTTNYCEQILRNAQDGQYSSFVSLASSLTSVVNQGLDNESYILNQYNIVDEGGYFPTKENELMLVLNHDAKTTDVLMTMLGYFSQENFETDMQYWTAVRDKTEISPELQEDFDALKRISIEDIKAKKFRYYSNDEVFEKLYTPGDLESYASPFRYSCYRLPSWGEGMEMNITCVLTPKETTSYGSLRPGLYYTPAFVQRMLTDAVNSEIMKFLPTYIAAVKLATGYDPGGYVTIQSTAGNYGIFYELEWYFRGEKGVSQLVLASTSSSIGSILSRRALGGNSLPSSIDIYPNSFKDKYEVTEYLDKWNEEGDITLVATDKYAAKTLSKEDRQTVKYSDYLEVIIFMINSMIQMVTAALIAFTSLSLVVSTVMIAIITYVSVMERIKEIGVIRALGGRKKDVSHLFNAETFIIGGISGVFGLAITYLLQGILNWIIYGLFAVGPIANLTFWVALLILGISILLTMIAGFIPSRLAAKKDPVVALRTE